MSEETGKTQTTEGKEYPVVKGLIRPKFILESRVEHVLLKGEGIVLELSVSPNRIDYLVSWSDGETRWCREAELATKESEQTKKVGF